MHANEAVWCLDNGRAVWGVLIECYVVRGFCKEVAARGRLAFLWTVIGPVASKLFE